MKKAAIKIKKYSFLILTNLIAIALVVIAFEQFFLIKYYNQFLEQSNKIELKVDRDKSSYSFQDCKDPLAYSFVDTMGPHLLRDEDFGFFLSPTLDGVNARGFLFDCFDENNSSDDFKVVLIGDSFTASTQVPISKTWPSLLRDTIASRLPSKNVRLYNLATGGAGMLHQYQQSIFTGNDLTDEDFESFQLTQAPHKNFPPYAFKQIEDGKISHIRPNLHYYGLMNLAHALDTNGHVLLTKFGLIDLKLDWFWNESKDISDSPYMLYVADVQKDKRRQMTDYENDLFGIDKLNITRSTIPAVKPSNPASNYAITGLYFADETAPDRCRDLLPSERGELEIVSLLNSYLEEGALNVERMGRGFSWLDTGTHVSLLDASNFVKTMTERQGLQVGSPDEVAFHQNWISREDLVRRAKMFYKNHYGKYLEQLALDVGD